MPLEDGGGSPTAARRLAWVLLFDVSGSETVAEDWCGAFATEVVERLPGSGSLLGHDEIVAWLDTWPA